MNLSSENKIKSRKFSLSALIFFILKNQIFKCNYAFLNDDLETAFKLEYPLSHENLKRLKL